MRRGGGGDSSWLHYLSSTLCVDVWLLLGRAVVEASLREIKVCH